MFMQYTIVAYQSLGHWHYAVHLLEDVGEPNYRRTRMQGGDLSPVAVEGDAPIKSLLWEVFCDVALAEETARIERRPFPRGEDSHRI